MNIKLRDIKIDYEPNQDFLEAGLPWVATYGNLSAHFRHKPTKHQAKDALEHKFYYSYGGKTHGPNPFITLSKLNNLLEEKL